MPPRHGCLFSTLQKPASSFSTCTNSTRLIRSCKLESLSLSLSLIDDRSVPTGAPDHLVVCKYLLDAVWSTATQRGITTCDFLPLRDHIISPSCPFVVTHTSVRRTIIRPPKNLSSESSRCWSSCGNHKCAPKDKPLPTIWNYSRLSTSPVLRRFHHCACIPLSECCLSGRFWSALSGRDGK